MEIKKVAVLGCGLMGSGIAEVSAKAGYQTVVLEAAEKFLEKGLGRIEKSLGKAVKKGKLREEESKEIRGRIQGTLSVGDLAGCDLYIEAVIEDEGEKKKLYEALHKVAGKEAIFASNTSSLSITALAAASGRPDRFLGLHFFNPVPVMKLVEVMCTAVTLPEVLDAGEAFVRKLGKEPIRAPDTCGFLVNRLLIPYLLDAIRLVEAKVAEPEAIDKAMTLGTGYPMGPLTLLDFVGLDTTLYITEVFFDAFRETRYAPPALLRQMVALGHLGRKSGKGFYDYS
jgi:3-hydroxybutyryl-CoA dehydrogenase